MLRHTTTSASGMEALQKRLNDQIDAFKDASEVDYHPGSQKKVRDIVHPGLYCHVLADGAKRGEAIKFDSWGRDYVESKFSWLPSVVLVSVSAKWP